VPATFTRSIIRDKHGNLAAIVSIGRDMREINELISQLDDKTKKLANTNIALIEATAQLVQSEKLAALGELTAIVAHELNQPLNGIKIICQSILRDIKRERFKTQELEGDMSDVVSQVNKMAEIIDHMRIYTRRTEGIPDKKIDIKNIIQGALRFVEQQLEKHNIKVIKELSQELPEVIGDPIRLEQVFLNLITNARKALDSSQKSYKYIKFSTYRIENGNYLAAEVTDNGAGIPEQIQEKIFEPFFSTKEPGKGTGLGLSMANKIIEEHGGRIEVDSKVGQGATFRVLLPIVNN